MNTRAIMLFAHRQLLRLYPAEFRERFAEEMIEIAKAAESSEWPLILGDTGLTILRRWLQPGPFRSHTLVTAPGQYLAIGASPVDATKLLQGLAVASVVTLLACCISMSTAWHLPTDKDMACGVPDQIVRTR
jgi:hypothetical protein